MNGYYCHPCGEKLITRPLSAEPFRTPYQVGRYGKHTGPPQVSSLHSIFSDQSTAAYTDYLVTAAASGYVQVDDRGTNLVWFADRSPGIVYASGAFQASANAIKLVLPQDADHLHIYPVHISATSSLSCAACGAPLPTDQPRS